MNYINQAVFT